VAAVRRQPAFACQQHSAATQHLEPAAVSGFDSLPSGAKVGIGVAVGVAGLLIIATTVLLVHLRRARIRQRVAAASAPNVSGQKPELEGDPSQTFVWNGAGNHGAPQPEDLHVLRHEVVPSDSLCMGLGNSQLRYTGERAELGG
jgi:hypothetical protein